MATQSREQLKMWFRKGEYPTEEQFGALIESMAHREDRMAISSVEGLAEVLNGKLGRGEAGVLRGLLEEFGGFGALGFSGFDGEARVVENGLPGRMELAAALAGGSVGVVYNRVSGSFMLRVETAAWVRFYSAWGDVEGVAGRVVSRSTEYRAGVLLMSGESGPGRFYTWDGRGEPRCLGYLSPVCEDIGNKGALTPGIKVEHLAQSVKMTFDTVDADGTPGKTGVTIGAAKKYAGLMLPAHVKAIEELSERMAELQEGLGSAKGSDPLPFVFVRNETILPQGVVAFSRDSNAFFFEGDGEMPQGYDETLPDGSVRPSTSARFVCGNVVYRFTGSQMVNTAIEADANRRLVRRMPSTTSHPGLAYIDRGRIRVPLPYPEPDAEFRVSLKGMFIDNRGWGGAQPLIPLSQMVPSGQGVEDLRIEDDSIVGTFANAVPDFVRVCLCCPGVVKDGEVPDPDGRHNWDGGKNHFIGVRFDDKGRKIFYRFDSAFPANDIPIPTLGDAEELLRVSTEGPPGLGFSLWRRWGDFQVQVWRRRRNYISKRVVWKWINIPEDGRRAVRMRRCLVRMRRANRSGISPWAYFNVNSEGEITVSRQERI